MVENDDNEDEFTSISISKTNLEECNKLKRKLENHHGKNLRMNFLISNLIHNFHISKNIDLNIIEI